MKFEDCLAWRYWLNNFTYRRTANLYSIFVADKRSDSLRGQNIKDLEVDSQRAQCIQAEHSIWKLFKFKGCYTVELLKFPCGFQLILHN